MVYLFINVNFSTLSPYISFTLLIFYRIYLCYNAKQLKRISRHLMEKEKSSQPQKTTLIIIVIITILFLIGITIGVVFLAKSDAQITSQVRDIFIIILVMESFLIGAALIILIIQLALLSNLLQNEIKPILFSTKETIRTVKGTSQFISERAVKPIVSIGGILAGGRKLFEIIGFIKKDNKKE